MTYVMNTSNDVNENAVFDLGHAETVGSLYEDQTESTVGALTINYIHDFPSKVFGAFLKLDEISEAQFNNLQTFLIWLLKTEEKCQNRLTKNIDVAASVEGEFCFYRSTDSGMSLLSIDEDGDILFNYTGYKDGFITKQYYNKDNIDFEKIVYDFLAN